MSQKHEMKAIRKALESEGWEIVPGGKGYDFAVPPADLEPRGPYATDERIPSKIKLPSTPSGVRWRENLLAVLRRRGFRGKGL